MEEAEMATKERKSMIRIDPQLAHEVAVIAKIRGVPGYKIAEEAIRFWIINQNGNILKEARDLLKDSSNE